MCFVYIIQPQTMLSPLLAKEREHLVHFDHVLDVVK